MIGCNYRQWLVGGNLRASHRMKGLMDENEVTVSERESSLIVTCKQDSRKIMFLFLYLISFHYIVNYLLSEGNGTHFIGIREVSVICKTWGELSEIIINFRGGV